LVVGAAAGAAGAAGALLARRALLGLLIARALMVGGALLLALLQLGIGGTDGPGPGAARGGPDLALLGLGGGSDRTVLGVVDAVVHHLVEPGVAHLGHAGRVGVLRGVLGLVPGLLLGDGGMGRSADDEQRGDKPGDKRTHGSPPPFEVHWEGGDARSV